MWSKYDLNLSQIISRVLSFLWTLWKCSMYVMCTNKPKAYSWVKLINGENLTEVTESTHGNQQPPDYSPDVWENGRHFRTPHFDINLVEMTHFDNVPYCDTKAEWLHERLGLLYIPVYIKKVICCVDTCLSLIYVYFADMYKRQCNRAVSILTISSRSLATRAQALIHL